MNPKMTAAQNPYDILKVDKSASNAAIRTAFRKQALICHPDKAVVGGPADSQAFLQLCQAIECLLDGDQRRGLDQQLNAAQVRRDKNTKLDVQCVLLKTKLEERERESEENAAAVFEEDRISRLRREAEDLLIEDRRDDDLSAAFRTLGIKERSDPIVKVKWGKTAENPYTAVTLSVIFGKYGEVVNVVSSKHGRSALVEFRELGPARIAFNCESGLRTHPLELKALFSDTRSRYITVQCARTNRSLLDFEDEILAKLSKNSEQ